MFIASALFGVSTFLAYLSTNFYVFAIFFNGITGIGQGLIYMPIYENCFKYFPTKKGFVSGIINSGFGFGAFIFSQIAQFVVNPDNISSEKLDGSKDKVFPEKVYENFPTLILILSFVYLGLTLNVFSQNECEKYWIFC